MQGKNPLGDFSFPNTKSAGSGGNPLPSVPKISGVSNVTVPGSGQKVSSNGSAIQANLKSGMPTLPSNPLDIQSLQSGSNQAFNLAKGLPAAINAKFPNISPFTDPAVTAAFNSDLAKAQQTMNKELPGAIAEANAAFGKAQKQLSQTSPGKIGGNIMAGAKNPASLASLPKGLSI